jgi:hypothetical protein
VFLDLYHNDDIPSHRWLCLGVSIWRGVMGPDPFKTVRDWPYCGTVCLTLLTSSCCRLTSSTANTSFAAYTPWLIATIQVTGTAITPQRPRLFFSLATLKYYDDDDVDNSDDDVNTAALVSNDLLPCSLLSVNKCRIFNVGFRRNHFCGEWQTNLCHLFQLFLPERTLLWHT